MKLKHVSNGLHLECPRTQIFPNPLKARWSPHAMGWHFPGAYRTVSLIARYYGNDVLSPQLQELLGEPWGFPRVPISTAHPAWNQLYQYQQEAVQYLLSSPHRGTLLNLSPGLGKTAVSIVAGDILGAEKVLVVCPKTIIPTWRREAALWGAGWEFGGDRVITNYEQLLRKGKLRDFQHPWDLVILDESLRAKNRKTKTFQTLKKITSYASKVWELSGSPISRHNDDLWSQFHLLSPREFSSYWRFAEYYCVVSEGIWGRSVDGDHPNRDVRGDYRDFIFTRHLDEVLPDLPDYIWQTYDLELIGKQRKLYDQARQDFIVELESGEELALPGKMAQMTRLLQIVSHPMNVDPEYSHESVKLSALRELIESGALPLPTLIWVHYRPGAEACARTLGDLGLETRLAIGGQDNDPTFREFQEGNVQALVVGLGVGKYGLTLTRARSVVYLDRTWDADAYVQSLYRVKRLGLSHRPLVVVLRCPGTIEDLVEQNLAGKLPSISRLTNADLLKLLFGLNPLSSL